jgi:hypothetical protein
MSVGRFSHLASPVLGGILVLAGLWRPEYALAACLDPTGSGRVPGPRRRPGTRCWHAAAIVRCGVLMISICVICWSLFEECRTEPVGYRLERACLQMSGSGYSLSGVFVVELVITARGVWLRLGLVPWTLLGVDWLWPMGHCRAYRGSGDGHRDGFRLARAAAGRACRPSCVVGWSATACGASCVVVTCQSVCFAG